MHGTWLSLKTLLTGYGDLPKFCLICAPAFCLKGANKQKIPPQEVCEVKSQLWPQRTECRDEVEGEQWELRGRRKSCLVFISFFEIK